MLTHQDAKRLASAVSEALSKNPISVQSRRVQTGKYVYETVLHGGNAYPDIPEEKEWRLLCGCYEHITGVNSVILFKYKNVQNLWRHTVDNAVGSAWFNLDLAGNQIRLRKGDFRQWTNANGGSLQLMWEEVDLEI
jgi:hypothetical protein